MQPNQPPGIESILAALQTGGQPMGQLGKIPSPVTPGAQPISPAVPTQAGMPQMGTASPLQGGMGDIDPAMLNMILEALMRGGAFNAQQAPQQ